jgi:hypothetical protein
MRKCCLVFIIFLFIVSVAACSPSPQPTTAISEVELTATQVPPSATPLPPMDTPVPTQTDTPEPTPSPTPRIIKLQDDFSSRSEIWGECENCVWEEGRFIFGPFEPHGTGQDQIFYIFCEACGENKYYRVAADVTYVEGYGGDRTFGILAGMGINDVLAAGTVSTSQHALYETFDLTTKRWGGTPFRVYGAVAPGSGTNHIEVSIVPAKSRGGADITVAVNGKNLILLYDQKVVSSKVGLYLGWHSIGVAFDNFEYEQFEMPEAEAAALSLTPCDIVEGDIFHLYQTVGVTGTLTRVTDQETIWTATLEGGGCELPVSLDIEKYRVWVEEEPGAFENGTKVYLVGEVGAFMQGEFDPEDFSTFDAYLALEVDVKPKVVD